MKPLLLVALLSQLAVACPSGYDEYRGDCVYNAPDAEPQKPVVPDDVRPPRGVQPQWETGAVTLSTATSVNSYPVEHYDPEHPKLITR